MAYMLRSARYLSHDVLREAVQAGDTVIDATMGNGHDTLFLCQLVGETGKVIAYDVQPQAVESTKKRLAEAGVDQWATLHCRGHEHMDEAGVQNVAAIVFNLGWLPGGDKSITTLWETTQVAISAALSLLVKGGICTVCAYPGHEEGDRERFALMDWLSTLRPQEYNVLHHRFLNAGPGAPECFVIQKQWGNSHGDP